MEKRKKAHWNRTTALIIGITACSLTLAACEKSRPDQYPNGTVDTPISKSDIENAKMQITTSAAPLAESDSAALRADTAGSEVSVVHYNGPGEFAPMFQDLRLQAQPATTYNVRFALDRQYVTAYLEVSAPSQLTVLQQQLATQFASELATQGKTSGNGHDLMLVGADERANTAVTRVPIFQYKVEAYGVVNHALNDLNEQTNTLRLDQTDWPSAQAIQLGDMRESDRMMVQLPIGDTDQNRIFVKDQLNDKLFTKSDLGSELQISTSDPNPDTQYYSKVDGDNMTLYRVMQPNCSKGSVNITMDQCQAIQSGDSGYMTRAGVLPCTDSAKASLGANPSSCYMVQAFQVAVTPVVASRKVSDDNATPDVQFQAAPDANSAQLVRITLKPNVTKFGPTDSDDLMDPTKTLVVDKMKGEFLMTRTLTDSPSQFADTFTGNASGIEIVRFVFDKDRVRVVRSKSQVQRIGVDSLDNETLLTIPAKYYVLASTAPDGTKLAAPIQQVADPTTPGAIALLDWTKNELPEANSPLTYYGIDQCFDSTAEPEVSDVSYNKDARQLSFSYLRSYQASNDMGKDCAGIYSYMYSNAGFTAALPQTVFRFKERISFRAYNSADDNKVLLNMPFEAQKELGFGMFTSRVQIPDQYGNTDKIGTEKDLVSLWDLSGGKQITYVLAGVPDDGVPSLGVSKADIVQAAREVIADLNKAFREALKGSPLQRADGPSGDVLVLKVEGEDAPKGELGDINRNTIYWVNKQFTSTIIGLAQAQPNPRSGLIETSNVYVYGGNIVGYVPYARRMAEAAKYYKDNVESIDQQTADLRNQLMGNADPNAAGSPAGAPAGAAGSNSAPAANSSQANVARLLMNPEATVASTLNVANLAAVGARVAANPELFASTGLSNVGGLLTDMTSSELSGAAALDQAIETAKKTGAIMDQNALESVIDANLGQIVGNISPSGAAYAQSLGARMALKQKIEQRFQSMGVCAYDRAELDMTGSKVDTTKWSDKEWVLRIFKPTLAHEIGHTLGLRHNFQGSYDKANWKFSSDEKTPREYSSIMDYMEDDHVTYDGMGPYDVEALRAAYTGRLQLADGSLTTLDQVLKASGASNWTDFTRVANPGALRINGQPLKHFDFCTDEDTIGDPTCLQFDKGSTPLEIVNHDIEEYNAYYPIRHFPNDELSLSLDTTGGYISATFMRFMQVRKFLDEMWYQLVGGLAQNDPPAMQNYFQAFIRGMWFFNSVIRTPDVPMPDAIGNSRFTVDFEALQTPNGVQKLPHLVERRALQDVNVADPNSDELLVRGILWDKLVATIMLTEQSFGFPRYVKRSLSISYPDAESMLLQHQSPLQLPTTELLEEMINGVVQPMVWSGGQPYFASPALVSADSDNLAAQREVSFYGDLGAILNLDTDADVVSQAQNMSVLFRVLGTSGVPGGITSVLMPGASGNGEGDLRYWAPASATITNMVVKQANALAQVQAMAPKLKPLLAQWVVQKFGSTFTLAATAQATQTQATQAAPAIAPAPAPSPSASPAAPANPPANQASQLEQQINALLAQLPPEAGAMQDQQGNILPLTTDALAQEIQQLLSRAADIVKVQATQASDTQQGGSLTETVQAYQNATQTDVNNTPTFGLLLSIFSQGEDGSPALATAPAPMQQIISILPLDIAEGITVNNLKVLDDLYVKAHPEALREYQ